MIRSLYSSETGEFRTGLAPAEIRTAFHQAQGFVWLDLETVSSEETLPLLQEIGLHPLAIHDILAENFMYYQNNIEDWENYAIVTLGIVDTYKYQNWLETVATGTIDELIMVLSKGGIITYHLKSLEMINLKWDGLERTSNTSRMNSIDLFRELISKNIENYIEVARYLDARTTRETIEAKFDRASKNQNERMIRTWELISVARSHFDNLRRTLDKLVYNGLGVINVDNRSQFREMYERTNEIRNEFLRLEQLISLRQPTGTQPLLPRLTNTVRKMMDASDSIQNRTIDASNSTQSRTIYKKHSIFISYRRADSIYVTGHIYDRLVSHFGDRTVFKDVDSIGLGSNFRETLENALRKCKVVLAIIGDQWVTIQEEDGSRRLDNSKDFVRIEIESALARRIPLIPVLVQGARMPSREILPPSLAKLTDYQGLLVRPDPDFHNDMNRLIKHLDERLR